MTITRGDIEVGGTVYMKTRHVQGATDVPKRRRAEVLSIERAAVRIKTLDDSRQRVVRFNELEPDAEWQAEWDAKQAERDAQKARDSHYPTPRLVEPTEPSLKVGIGEALQSKGQARPSAPPPAPVKSRPTFVPNPPKSARDVDDGAVDQWLAQGRALLEPMQEEVWALEEEISELTAKLDAATKKRDARFEQLSALEAVLVPTKGKDAAQ